LLNSNAINTKQTRILNFIVKKANQTVVQKGTGDKVSKKSSHHDIVL